MSYSPDEIARFVKLYSLNIIPLRVIVGSLTCVLYEYLETLPDEVNYIWPQRRSFGKYSYFFVRYYTVALLIFDVLQIHTFAIPGVATNTACVAINPTTRIAGAISLWSIEIIMQVRIYALYRCSKSIAIFNGVMFALSIAGFFWILVPNAMRWGQSIETAVRLPLPGCPVINGGTGWALWLPATGMEVILFGLVLYRAMHLVYLKVSLKQKVSVHEVLIGDNMMYFFGVTILLVFNNLMAAGALNIIPWFSYGPFHAAIGIMTTRMLVHLRKLAVDDSNDGDDEEWISSPKFRATMLTTTAPSPSNVSAESRRHYAPWSSVVP